MTKKAEKKTNLPPKEILNPFYDLASYDSNSRQKAALKLLNGLRTKTNKKTLQYVLERLIKGLASPRENARLGFSIALTEVLKFADGISCEDVLTLMDEHLSLKSAGENAKNNAIGQLLCIISLIRSKKCFQALDKVFERLSILVTNRPYLETIWAQAIISLSELADDETFRNLIWPAIKPVINVGLDSCSPNILWILLELDKTHQKYIRKKAKLFESGNWPPSEEKDFLQLGQILGKGAQSTPSGIHPLAKCVLSTMISGDIFDSFWNHTVTGFLLINADKLISGMGIRMIGEALAMTPSKKQLKCIFSTETIKGLLKSLLDRRFAAKFALSIARQQLDAIQNFVATNKANTTVQVMILKRFLDVSLNFDSISGSTLIHGMISDLSIEAAGALTDELIAKLRNFKEQDDGKQLQPSEIVTAMRLLLRIFECSKFNHFDAVGYRWKILDLLAHAAFMKTDFTSVNAVAPLSTTDFDVIRNIFMRCLESLCIVSVAQRGNRPKLEFPQESMSTLGEIIDLFIDRKHGHISEKCNLTLKPEQESVGVRAATFYHQLSKQLKKAGKNNEQEKDKGFLILTGYLIFWFICEPNEYMQSLEDILSCYENSNVTNQPSSGPSWVDVLVDVLLSIMSRPHRYVRAPLQVAFHYFCPLLKLDNIQPLLKALKPSETNAFFTEGDELEESDSEPADQPNGEVQVDKWTSSDEESEVDDASISGGDDEDTSVDPAFRRAVEDALGDAAAHSDTESIASDLTDEAMLKLDESLAAVFRSHLSGVAAKKSARDIAEQAQAFRVRCFDLIFVLLHSQPSRDLLVGMVLPILNVANEAVKISDQKNVFNRAKQVIERIVQIKKLPSASRDDENQFTSNVCQTIKDVVDFADHCANPSVHLLASECLRFLLKCNTEDVATGDSQAFEVEMKTLFSTFLDQYLKERSCPTPTCIFIAAFQKRPHMFLEMLPALAHSVFNDDIRPFRRHEACTLIHCLLIKDALSIINDKAHKKALGAWKRFVDCLHTGTLGMISKLDVNDDSQANSSPSTTSFKPNDLFEILTILRAVVNLRDTVPIYKLQDNAFLAELDKISQSSNLGHKTGKFGTGRKRTKLSTICLEITKKLRQSTVTNGTGGAGEKEIENQETPLSPPLKRRKTKT